MIDIQLIALILLTLRLISSGILLTILKKQIVLIRENNPPTIQVTRLTMFILTFLMFLGNFIPIAIDLSSLLNSALDGRKTEFTLLIAYALSNAITALLASLGLAKLYKDDNMDNNKPQEKEEKDGRQ